jgi:hypothetical protein
METKFGIKVPLFDNDYLWITEGDSKFHLRPLLFDTKEKALEHALSVWGEDAIIVEYTGDSDEGQRV